MAFTRVRTIKGKRYLYREERWREGKKVRSRSTFLGAVSGFIGANLSQAGRSSEVTDEMLAQFNAREATDAAERAAFLGGLEKAYGLKVGPSNPEPVEKTVATSTPVEQSPTDAPVKAS